MSDNNANAIRDELARIREENKVYGVAPTVRKSVLWSIGYALAWVASGCISMGLLYAIFHV